MVVLNPTPETPLHKDWADGLGALLGNHGATAECLEVSRTSFMAGAAAAGQIVENGAGSLEENLETLRASLKRDVIATLEALIELVREQQESEDHEKSHDPGLD